jgi:hypothetical protein
MAAMARSEMAGGGLPAVRSSRPKKSVGVSSLRLLSHDDGSLGRW